MTSATISRDVHFTERVLFLDGLTGTGKTMLAPILSSLQRVEVQRVEGIYEYMCALRYLGRIEEDAANAMIRMYVDQANYNLMIGRESNFRWKDLSGVLSNPGGWRYVRRLFQADGPTVIDRIKRNRPIPLILSHQALGIYSALFSALGERVRVVEAVRSPLNLLSHWYSYIDRFGADPRDFTIWIDHNGSQLPWFVFGWEDKYLSANKMDRVIYAIDWLSKLGEERLEALDEQRRRQVLVIPFERFVLDPWPYIRRLEELLDTSTTSSTRRTMRKQKVPRKITTAGRDLPIYRRYSWRPPPKQSTEAAELQKRWDYAAQEATGEGMETLERLCADYDQRYMKDDSSI